MKKYLLHLAGYFGISTATSSAALLFTFSEESGDVVMRTSGSVNITNASLLPFPLNASNSMNVFAEGYRNYGTSTVSVNIYGGVDLLVASFSTGMTHNADVGAGSASSVNGTSFYASPAQITSGVVTLTTTMTWQSTTLANLGMGHHANNMEIDLWAAHTGAGDAETIRFKVVEAVPEPSSSALLGLGALSLLLRRRR